MSQKDKEYYIEWLGRIKNEIYHLAHINEIGHDINRIINKNKELSRDSDLWTYLDKSYTCNVIINLTKILEPPKKNYKGDRSFLCFLNELDPQLILSKKEYISMFPAPDPITNEDEELRQFHEDWCQKLKEERSTNYLELTKGLSPTKYLEDDKEKLQKLFEYFRDFRVYHVAHMKETKKIAAVKYDDVTNAIENVVELAIKYSILMDGSRPVYLKAKPNYGNVFDIPWTSDSPKTPT